jgi:hypothetical protein
LSFVARSFICSERREARLVRRFGAPAVVRVGADVLAWQ